MSKKEEKPERGRIEIEWKKKIVERRRY